ncbi:MAG: protein kinase [Rickettsiales bacterium]|jgi:serine/threonine protein kinase|nr:protein kinase [Rickettsiales bacterium]
MAPGPATSRDLKNLQEAIKYNPSLFEALRDELTIDPVGVTINRQRVTKLGEGTCGVVYKIHCRGQWVALKIDKNLHQEKIFLANIINGGDYIVAKAFEKEESSRLQALMGIEYSSLGGKVLMSELCEGGDWSENRSDDRDIIEADLIPLIFVVKAFHDKNIVHRDIKSGNILVTKNGELKVGDYGSAENLDLPSSFNENLIGSPLYIAPEALLLRLSLGGYRNNPEVYIKNGRAGDLKMCDCWALGMTLCEKILHEHPYHIFAKKYIKTLPDLFEVNELILKDPEAWKTFISRELKKVDPPLGQLLRTAIEVLLEPNASKALSIDGVLDKLSELSKLNATNMAEYEKLYKKSNEQAARELEQKRGLEEKLMSVVETEQKERESKEEETNPKIASGTVTQQTDPSVSPLGIKKERSPVLDAVSNVGPSRVGDRIPIISILSGVGDEMVVEGILGTSQQPGLSSSKTPTLGLKK